MSDKLNDATATLGTILNGDNGRDAVHVAVVSAQAGERLEAGNHVGLAESGRYVVAAKGPGIVDPYLFRPVNNGEWFWLFLYPRTITGLRHVWSHPEFPDVPADYEKSEYTKAESEAWLRDYCKYADCPGFDRVMEMVKDHDGSDSLHSNGDDATGEIPPEFWDHVDNYLGIHTPKKNRAGWFSCSC